MPSRRRREDSVTVQYVIGDSGTELVTTVVYGGKEAKQIIAFIEDENLKPQSEQED